MKERRLLGVALTIIMVVLACSPDGPTDPAYHLSKQTGYLIDSTQMADSVHAYMTHAGCTAVIGRHPPKGAVYLPTLSKRGQTFDCAALPHDSVRALIRGYAHKLGSWSTGDHVEAGYWELYVETTTTCESEETPALTPIPAGHAADWYDVQFDGVDYGNYYVEGGQGIILTAEVCDTVVSYYGDYYSDDGSPATPPVNIGEGGGGGGYTGGPGQPPTPPTVVSVAVSPGVQMADSGDYDTFQATATYSNSTVVTGAAAIWTTSNTAVAAKDADVGGNFDAIDPGAATITAVVGGVSGTAVLSIDAGMLDDASGSAGPPNCSHPKNPMEVAYCRGHMPGTTERPLLDSALARMRLISSTCAGLADVVDSLLGRGTFQVFGKIASDSFSGSSPQGGGKNGWMILDSLWFTSFYDAAHATTGEPFRRTLQEATAHEADHALGNQGPYKDGHSDPQGYTTPNSEACSDVH